MSDLKSGLRSACWYAFGLLAGLCYGECIGHRSYYLLAAGVIVFYLTIRGARVSD